MISGVFFVGEILNSSISYNLSLNYEFYNKKHKVSIESIKKRIIKVANRYIPFLKLNLMYHIHYKSINRNWHTGYVDRPLIRIIPSGFNMISGVFFVGEILNSSISYNLLPNYEFYNKKHKVSIESIKKRIIKVANRYIPFLKLNLMYHIHYKSINRNWHTGYVAVFNNISVQKINFSRFSSFK